MNPIMLDEPLTEPQGDCDESSAAFIMGLGKDA